MRNRVWTGLLASMVLGAQIQAGSAQAGQSQDAQAQAQRTQTAQQEMLAQQAIPDAPKPQTELPDVGLIAPGKDVAVPPSDAGSTADAHPANPTFTPGRGAGAAAATPAAAANAAAARTGEQRSATDSTPVGDMNKAETIFATVNVVNVPFTVKDGKGKLVAGLKSSDIRVFENEVLQRITRFTTDAAPLSVALVVDQTLSHGNMERVDDALGALQNAFAASDEIAVFTYNNGPKMLTAFTGAQSARLTQAVEEAKGLGRDTLMAGTLSGPLSQTTVINNQSFDPNTTAVRGQNGIQLNVPKEQHTLNDAILAAAKALSTRPIERRRVIYVISDGREYGSKAKTHDVIRYLETNNIEVDGTLVGDSSLPVVGFLDKINLPMTMHDNILPQYKNATGGVLDAEFRTGEIEKSFARIANEVRSRYTLEYHTHLSAMDNKFRSINVVVIGHGSDLTVMAKKGYYPLAQPVRAHATSGAQ